MRLDPNRIERLQGMAVFGGLNADALACLLRQARLRLVPAGAWLFREGDPGSAMYVLESGRVRLLKGWQGSDHALKDLAAGDCFGEMSLMDLGPRSASVQALADCSLLEIDGADLMHLFEADVEQFALLQMNLGREVCRRLRATDELLLRLGG